MARERTDPIQEQLIQARQKQILDAATAVFAKRGFHRTTIRDIAQAAGIADGTIYNYFQDKTALLLGIMNRLNETEQREDDLAKSAEMDVRSFTQSYLRQRLAAINEGFEMLQVVLSEVLIDPKLRKMYTQRVVEPTFALAEKYFERAITQGKIRRLDVPLTMRMISGMVLGLLLLRIMGDQHVRSRWDDLPDLMTTLILDGLNPTEGG